MIVPHQQEGLAGDEAKVREGEAMARRIGTDYILNERREPVACHGSAGLAWWAAHPDAWKVAAATIGSQHVITSFMGRNLHAGEPPHCFATEIFSPHFDRHAETYASWTEAEAGHARWVAAVQAAEGDG